MTLDFAQILYFGIRMGLGENDVAHMYYGKWSQLFTRYRREWNMRIKGMIYAEPEEEKSVLDL